MKRFTAASALALMPLAMISAQADTIFFHDGTSLDGKASRPHPNAVRLEVEGGDLTFPADSVARIEENDKVGKYTLQVNPHTLRHITVMEESTGLTAEEQEELFALMKPLSSEEGSERHRATQAILEKAKQKDIFQFLAHTATSTTERYLPQVLGILVEIDPVRAREVVTTHLTQQHPTSRGAAVELLARAAGAEAVPVVAQGMVDPEPEVQVAAAQGLALTGARGATPALLQGLESPNGRVRAASEQALKQLWGTEETKTPQDWRTHWEQNRSSAENPIDPAQLKPLVEKEDPLTTTAYYE